MYPVNHLSASDTAHKPVEVFISSCGVALQPPQPDEIHEYIDPFLGWLMFLRNAHDMQPYGTAILFRATKGLCARAYNYLYPLSTSVENFPAFKEQLFLTYNTYDGLSVKSKGETPSDEWKLAERQAIDIAVAAVNHCSGPMSKRSDITDAVLNYAINTLRGVEHRTPDEEKALRDALMISGRYGELTLNEKSDILDRASVWLASEQPYENRGALMSSYWYFISDAIVSDEPELIHYSNAVADRIYTETSGEEVANEKWIAAGAEFCADLFDECFGLNQSEKYHLDILARLNYAFAKSALSRMSLSERALAGKAFERMRKAYARLA